MKLYISGKIAGLDVREARSNFGLVQLNLEHNPYSVHNPYNTKPMCFVADKKCTPDDPAFEHSWACYLRYDIIDMLACDGVALLWNWNDSKGAVLELFVARQCGLPVKMYDAWDAIA